jgi:hypothetical protein
MKILIEVKLQPIMISDLDGKTVVTLYGMYDSNIGSERVLIASETLEENDCPIEWEREIKKILLEHQDQAMEK